MKWTHSLQGWFATYRSRRKIEKKTCAECGTYVPTGLAVPQWDACSEKCAQLQWAHHTA